MSRTDVERQGEPVSRVGVRDAGGRSMGFLARAAGPVSKREAARCFAFAGVNQAVKQEPWLGEEGGASVYAQPLVSAIHAFCGPMDKRSLAEARAALERGRADLAVLARLVYSAEAVSLNARALRLPRAFDGLGAEGLWPRGWVHHEMEKPDCQAWMWPSSTGVVAFGFGGPDGGALALAAGEANARCAPWFPIELSQGDDGARLELDVGLAWGSAVCARLAGCAWALPWASSEDGLRAGGSRGMDHRLARRLWMDKPDPWARPSGGGNGVGDAIKNAEEGGSDVFDERRRRLAEPMALAVGVNAGVRMALGGDERLGRLASATLVGWAAKARHGRVAESLETILSEGAHLPRVAAAMGPILARVQAGEMAAQGWDAAGREAGRANQGVGRL